MSLFQCEHCGCCENTALAFQGFRYRADRFDWTGIEELEGQLLCSACGPPRFLDLTLTGFGQWHDKFNRVYLPIGKFKTNKRGNLEHIETGSEDFKQYQIDA